MKRNFLAVILVICSVFCVYGQNTNPIDLVLLLNTSSGMGSSYENVNNYITGSFLSEFLRTGDTFHLIPFSDNPRLDVARRISGIGDVETIIGRMLLQYPVESGNNVGAAISYAEQYVSTLPSRPKKIVLVSIGGSDVSALASAANQRLGSNTTFDYVQVTPGQPLRNLPVSGRPPRRTGTASSTTTAQTPPQTTTSTATPAAQPPAPSQRETTTPTTTTTTTTTTTRQQESTGAVTGTSSQSGAEAGAQSSQVESQGTNEAAGITSGTDSDTGAFGNETGSTAGSAQGNQDNNVAGASTSTTATRQSAGNSFASYLPVIIGVVVLLLLLLALILFLASRRLNSKPNRVMASVASSSRDDDKQRFADHSKDLSSYAAGVSKQRTTPYADRPYKTPDGKYPVIDPSGPLLLNLFVEDQNTAIGKRNIHNLKSGYSLSVGGGKRDGFLIFLVPLPAGIGELRRNGSSLSFIPSKPRYFPDLGSNVLGDCLNKTIRIISDKNYEMRFRFEIYEDSLAKLNSVLKSVKVPG